MDGNERPAGAARGRLGPRGGGEGWLSRTSCSRRSTSSPTRSATRSRAARTRRTAHPGRAAHARGRHPRTSTRCSSSPAARRSTPAWWPSTPSSTGRGSRWRSRSPASSATATPSWTATRSPSASRSRGRPSTPSRPSGTPRTQVRRSLAITNTVGSSIARESDGVLYTHAGPEIGVAVDEDLRYPDGRRCTCSRCTWRRSEARCTPRRSRGSSTGCERFPARSTARWSWTTQIAALAERYANASDVLFIGRHTGLPGRPGGRAQAQGDLLHPRRGLPGRVS